MADDIDIEEHGLLDDHDVSGIFPDFPDLNVKTEVIDIEDGFDQHHGDLSVPSTSVIPDSTTDVDYQPPRSTDSPHIISSTSIPEEPEEITDRLDLGHLVKTNQTLLTNNETGVEILICDDGMAEEFDLSVNLANNDVSMNDASINDVSINDVSNNDVSINDVSINEKPDVSGVVDEFVDEINDNDKDAGNDEAFFGNCIILGSKAADVNREEYYEDDKCFNSFVNLEDWGPYLSESDCYCSECEILFATVNALDFHKMQAHSHLVAVLGDGDDAYASDDSPKDETVKAACNLCNSVLASKQGLKKHMRLMHNPNSIPPVRNNIILGTKKVSNEVKSAIKPQRTYAVKSSAAKTKNVEENTKKGAYACFVCQFQCNSDDGLIDHLYKFHTFRCDICNTVFAKKDEHEVHMLSHNPNMSVNLQNTEESKKKPSSRMKSRRTLMVRRCDGCPAQYARMRNLKKHYMALNIKWKEPLVANQEFDPVCPVCSMEVPWHKRYNDHVAAHDCHGKSTDGQIKVSKCQFCPAQFFTSKLLMDHCEIIHKINLDFKNKPIAIEAFNPRCPHCAKTFAFPGVFNKHLEVQHKIVISAPAIGLSKDATSNNFPSPLKLPLQTSTKVSFKCLKCNILLPDLVSANKHKESKHAKFGDEIIKKVTQQIALIQTSFLFRCVDCDVHFTSPSQADAHTNSNCTEQQNSIPCKQCNLKININDVASHKKKHEINDELTVIDISDNNLNIRILCKCPTCRQHFNECDFYSHYIECSAYSLIPYWCVFCDLYIDIKAQANHDSFHYELKLKKEALIVLEYKEIVNSSVTENIDDADNVVDKDDHEPKRIQSDAVRMDQLRTDSIRMDITSKNYKDKMVAIKTKTEGISKQIECTLCGTFRSFHSDSASHHLEGKCKKCKRRPCNLCGIRVLNVAKDIHKADHMSYPSLNIKDTLFFDESLNVIKPRVPKLFKCNHCSIHFESQYHLNRHRCESAVGKRCVHCNKDIIKAYYTYHMQYHEYRLPRLSGLEYAAPRYERNVTTEEDNVHKQGTSKSQPQINDESDNENTTQEKPRVPTFYQCAKNKKIMLYQCKKCKLSSVGNRFRHIHTICKTITFTCNVCDLKFAANYRVRHQQFHIHHPNINFNSYHIIQFDCKDSSKQNKTEASLNNYISSRKQLKLKKRGLAVFFQCSKCKLVSTVRTFTLKHQTCIKYANPYNCEICRYTCAPAHAESHKRWHQLNPNVKKEHIVTSSFKPGLDVKKHLLKVTTNKSMINHRPAPNNSLIKNAKYEAAVKKPIMIEPKRDNSLIRDEKNIISTKNPKMFQCSKCGISSISLSFPHNHTDCGNIKSFNCEQCGMKFFETFKNTHREFHINMPNATSDYFNLIRFDPDTVFRPISYNKWVELTRAGKMILIQCVYCKLASTSRQIMQNHLSCDNTQPFYSCKLCGYKLVMSEKQKHIATHMNRPQLKQSDILVSQFDPKIERQMFHKNRRSVYKPESNDSNADQTEKYIIFRCEICDVCTEEGTDHECKEGITKVVCNFCSLTFEDALYGNHVAKHSNPNYSKNVEIINIEGETPRHFRKRKSSLTNVTPTKIRRLSEVSSTNVSLATSDNVNDDIDQIFRCNCNLHFLSRVSCSNHLRTCKRDQFRQSSNICTYCNISFHSPKSLEEHTSRHHVGNKDFVVTSYAEFHKKRKVVVIYKCRDCLLFFPTYEQFKSNTHLATCGVSTGVICKVCRFDIMESFVNEHAKVHAIGKPRGAENFKVVVVSKDKIPLHVPAAESVLYKCTRCEVHFLNTDGIESHYPCENSSRRHTKCPECGLKFYSASLYAHVSAQHTKHNYDINDLVIKKVDPKDVPVKEEIPDLEVAPESEPESDSMSDQKATKRHTLYQCLQCKVNFISCKSILNQKSCSITKPAENFTCDKCNMVIYLPEKEEHFLIHHSEDNNLTCESDYVIHKKNSYQILNRNRKSAEKYPVFGCRSVKGGLKTGARNIKSVAKSRKIVGEEEEPNIIYKCYDCDICFICKGSLINHSPKYAEHESAKNKMPCHICGLQFGPWILKQHKIIHHEELNLKLEDFRILTIKDVRNDTLQESDISESDNTFDSSVNDSIDTSRSKTNNAVARKSAVLETPKSSSPGPSPKLGQQNKIKLYKCKECNVNFLKQNLCYRHVINHEPLSTYDFLECKICTLNFPIQYLQQHMAQHKKEYFDLKDILIEEYEPLQESSPGTKRSTPKIDIYNAIDRVSNNTIVINDNTSISTDNHQASNTSCDIKIINNELSKTSVDTDSKNEKTESSMLQILLETKKLTNYKTLANLTENEQDKETTSATEIISNEPSKISVDVDFTKEKNESRILLDLLEPENVTNNKALVNITENQQDNNTITDTENINNKLPNIITDTDSANEKTDNSLLEGLIETKNVMDNETAATESNVECKDFKMETASDGDAISLELSSKDDTSLQPMEIDTEYNDGKILDGSNLDGI